MAENLGLIIFVFLAILSCSFILILQRGIKTFQQIQNQILNKKKAIRITVEMPCWECGKPIAFGAKIDGLNKWDQTWKAVRMKADRGLCISCNQNNEEPEVLDRYYERMRHYA